MARHKDTNWNLPEGKHGVRSTTHSWESIHSALLMDIRDELKELNRLLNCRNFIAIPSILRGIRTNTTKRKRKVSL